MDSFSFFLIASMVVLGALIIALLEWYKIYRRSRGKAKGAAYVFMGCFALYIIGQTFSILHSSGALDGSPVVADVSYALAAIMFALGSTMQLKSLGK